MSNIHDNQIDKAISADLLYVIQKLNISNHIESFNISQVLRDLAHLLKSNNDDQRLRIWREIYDFIDEIIEQYEDIEL